LNDPAKRAVLQLPVSLLRCPSDTGPELNDEIDFSITGGSANLPVANYVANNGTYSFRNALGDPVASTSFNNGMFGGIGPTTTAGPGLRRFSAVSDGLSNTIALGERCWELAGVDYRAG